MIGTTIHGAGLGLDEAEVLVSLIAGFRDALADAEAPLDLRRIDIVERDARRAQRLRDHLVALLPAGELTWAEPHPHSRDDGPEGSIQRLRDRGGGRSGGSPHGGAPRVGGHAAVPGQIGRDSEDKPHVFVAMPFDTSFDDVFHYGIRPAIVEAGRLCERADTVHFTGDVMSWIERRIATADLVVADLSTASANVYLEVGWAWGLRTETVLLTRSLESLVFDVAGRRCLEYSTIRELEEKLRRELAGLGFGADGRAGGERRLPGPPS